jgi:HK97 gp10 family phage protein
MASVRKNRSNAKLYQSQNVTASFNVDFAATLRAYQQYIQDEVLRPAARAGVLEVYNEIRRRVPVDTGTLRDSVYHWYDVKQSTPTRHIYATGPNKRTAPHWHIVEYGTIKMAAQPYFRPAVAAKGKAALQAALERAREKMSELTG